jgi:hypothetical protein
MSTSLMLLKQPTDTPLNSAAIPLPAGMAGEKLSLPADGVRSLKVMIFNDFLNPMG